MNVEKKCVSTWTGWNWFGVGSSNGV